ncbi:hypothetical protein L593_09425 [Salinarchaeum sp. Harcht-Bsk1]|uniref:hypothetical protein n=1 Tax=Salinarchaeum sp. Harcht-Bsk1 TaxID=1333523 RepID=UPI0003422A25|nr:hypothetical protein [Salinarchaeum sp. Harcht-Bsk1]AGN01830.1 hypothetical protein L593_09425 [Salinarchaeum sp. Harcht-Bsk1]
MVAPSDGVRLDDGDWERAFERLDEQGGGVIRVPTGVTASEPARIDLADYPNLQNNVSIRGSGLAASVVDFGEGPGDGLSLVATDSDVDDGDDRTHVFYTEITGVGFQGARDGVLFRLGSDDFADAWNSCDLHLATNNGSPDATAACRLNFVLNSRHFGVHNTTGGVALDQRQVQFGGLNGAVSSKQGVSLRLGGGSFANVIEWLNVEACEDGVLIDGDEANINRFGMLYGANVDGTLWRHEAPVETRIDAAYVAGAVETIDRCTEGSYSVGLSNEPFATAIDW